ncbi:hypothetical protein LCGC14_2967540, partial [marine sediment metagenome]
TQAKIERKIKRIKQKDRFWYCKLCKKKYPNAPICVESHFSKKHPRTKYSDWKDDDFDKKGNWQGIYLTRNDEESVVKLRAKLSGYKLGRKETKENIKKLISKWCKKYNYKIEERMFKELREELREI